jgi:hypothetical protein
VSEHEAGAELDRLIAQKVMGWKIDENGDVGDGVCIDRSIRDEIVFESLDYRAHFHPSREIVHAWEVVERLATAGWDPVLSYDDGPGGWWLQLKRGILSFADAAPLAICRAALEAVEK